MSERVMVSSFAKNKYGVARDTRTLIEKVRDEGWRPVGLPIEHQHDERIRELQAKSKQAELDQEMQAAKTHEERELITLKRRRAADFAAQDAAAEKAAHLANVKGEIEFLRGLREKLAADPERTVSEIVRVDQAIEQFLVRDVPKSHGEKLLAEIKAHEAKRLADKRKFLNDQRLVFEQELAKLDAAIEGKPAPEPVAKIQVATPEERSAAVQKHLKETGNTVRLIEFFESEGSPEARQKILDEFSAVAPAESTVVVEATNDGSAVA